MKKRIPFLYKILIAIGFIILLAMLFMIPSVGMKVSTMLNVPAATVRTWAQTICAAGIGTALVTWGIAALAIPILGGMMIIIGLALIAYAVWPLFSSTTTGG